jgi:hypothetical protein
MLQPHCGRRRAALSFVRSREGLDKFTRGLVPDEPAVAVKVQAQALEILGRAPRMRMALTGAQLAGKLVL